MSDDGPGSTQRIPHEDFCCSEELLKTTRDEKGCQCLVQSLALEGTRTLECTAADLDYHHCAAHCPFVAHGIQNGRFINVNQNGLDGWPSD